MVHTFLIQGPRRKARLRLQGSFFVIGRAEPGFPVFQDDPTISREHAVVVATGSGVAVKDLGSRNGVMLNGRKLGRYEEVALAPGDEVLIGKTTVRLLKEQEKPDETLSEVTVDKEGRSSARVALARPAPVGVPAAEPSEEDADEDEDGLEKTQVEELDEAEETAALEPAAPASSGANSDPAAPGEEPEEGTGEETEDLEVPPELVEKVRQTGLALEAMEATQTVDRPEALPLPSVRLEAPVAVPAAEAEAGVLPAAEAEADAAPTGSLAPAPAAPPAPETPPAPEPAPVLEVPDEPDPADDESDEGEAVTEVDDADLEDDEDDGDAPGEDDDTEPGRPILE